MGGDSIRRNCAQFVVYIIPRPDLEVLLAMYCPWEIPAFDNGLPLQKKIAGTAKLQ
jgi:hypothetical protein